MSSESIDKILMELKRVEIMLLQFQKTGKIPDIEREIVLSKLRNIYEFIHIIQIQAVEKSIESTVDNELLIRSQTIDKEVEEVSIPEPEPVLNDFTLIEIAEDVSTNSAEILLTDTQVIQPAKNKPEAPVPIIVDQFRTDKDFLNEALANFQHLQNLSKKYQTKPIKDISSAISLNDKFLYIKELFNNDGNLYKQTIEVLNNSGDFNNAIKYIDEHFQWDFSDFQVQKILELVHRRYMPSEE